MKRKKHSTLLKILLLIEILFFSVLVASLSSAKKEIPSKAIISLTFDDGLKSHYESVFPLMTSFSYKGTEYVLANWSGLFENKELMTIEQAKEMQSSGWEIGSHSLNHPTLLAVSSEEADSQLRKSREILELQGIQASSFAYPFGRLDNLIVAKTKGYYYSARTLNSGDNYFGSLNPYKLKSKTVKKDTSSEQVCEWISQAKEKNTWLILTFHHVGENAEKPWDVSLEDFNKILKYINETAIEVKTIEEGIKYNEKRN